MVDKISFKLQFTFDKGDGEKAVKLHKALEKYGVLSNVSVVRDDSFRKDERYKSILKSMSDDKEYTTGSLWKNYSKRCSTGTKTFQRDLNTLVVLGYIKGRTGIAPNKVGRTCYWQKLVVLRDRYDAGVNNDDVL
jgi:hypothetical protein